MNLKDKKVLITGAGGFIGSHLTEKLIQNGAELVAFVHYNSRNDWGLLSHLDIDLLKNIEVIMGDISDPFIVNKITKDIDVVFHLAALIGIPYSYLAPEHYVNVNIKGTLNVLQAGLDNNVEKIVHTSTSEAYGTAQYTPIDEMHPLQGQSPYSASKISADKLAESYYCSFDLPVATIRPFNTYGPRQSARAVIPTIISQALTKNEVRIGSLVPVRDMNFVEDTVRGFIAVAESDASVGEVINIGSGKGYTIGEILGTILNILDKKDLQVIEQTERIRPAKSEVMELLCDNSKAKKLLNWEPKYSLQEGLEKTVEWMAQNTNLYNVNRYII